MNKEWKLPARILSIFLAVAVITAGLPVAMAAETKKPKEDFHLLTMSDLHYYPECLTGDKQEPLYTLLDGSNAIYDDMDAMMDAAFESAAYEVKNNGIKNVVLVGDLTTNGEIEGHQAIAERLKKFEKETGANVWVTLGNHDIYNGGASTFSSKEHRNEIVQGTNQTSPQQFVEIYKDFGFNQYYHKYKDFYDGTHGALTYSVKLADEGVRLIMVDGGVYSKDCTLSGKNGNEINGFFSESQMKWIKDEAADAIKDDEIPMVFTHWNMSEMNYMHEKVLQGFVMDDAYKVQEELADAGIHYAFSGHQHVTDMDITYSDSGEPMYSIITPTLTQFPFAYRVTSFHRNDDESIKTTFDQHFIDEHAQVKEYLSNSYNGIGFRKQFGDPNTVTADAAKFVMKILKRNLSYTVTDIRKKGSILAYLKESKGIDLEEKIDELIHGGIKFEDIDILTARNVMAFLNDIDHQLMTKYFYDKDYLYSVLEDALTKIMDLPISDLPCTKFITQYGFGSNGKPGTFGDTVLSVLAYLYNGNEDISDDAFMQDVLKFSGTPAFADFVLNALRTYVVDDVLINNLFSSVKLNFDKFFCDDPLQLARFVQYFLNFVSALLGSNLLNSKDVNQFLTSMSIFISKYKENITIKNLIEAVLGTGLIKYGRTIDQLIDSLLAEFITDDFKAGLTYEAEHVIGSMVMDDEKDWGPDVIHTYSGPVKVTPTKEDMQLPTGITLAPGKDGSTSFTATWFTKYSVTGSDIEIMKKGAGNFTGIPTTANVESSSKVVTYTHPGYDAGVFGILPWEEDMVKHTVLVSNLEPGTEYVFRIGDAAKGFWEDGSVKTAPKEGDKFTFLHISDTDGFMPSQFENLSRTLTAAKKEFPQAQMIVHTGGFTEVSNNDKQWNWATESALEQFTSMPMLYASSAKDADGLSSVKKHWSEANLPAQNTENGLYYSCDYSNAHFIVINTNATDESGKLDDAQIKWIEHDLAKSHATWNILVMNKSIYGAEDNAALKAQLLKIMEAYKIDLILQGSDKIYARTKLMNNDKVIDQECDAKIINVDGRRYTAYQDSRGTVAVISGCAGRYFPENAPENAVFSKSEAFGENMFSAITIDGETLALGAYTVDEDGTTERVDQFAIQKQKTEIRMGDGNRDDKVTSDDARLALRTSVGLEKALRPIQKIAMDVDNSKTIESSDARIILRVSVGLEIPDPEFIYVYDSDIDRTNF